MAKENLPAEKDGKTAASGGKSKAVKPAADATENSTVSNGFLSKFRPKKRFVVFAAFLAICAGIVFLHDPCDVKKKKQDCGYPGISSLACATFACFTKGGGEMETKTIALKRKKGTKFGLVSGSKKGDTGGVFVKSIKEGAVEEHNAVADPEDRIYPRDTIVSIDGATGSALRKSLAGTSKEKVEIALKRSKLPSFLRWMHRETKPGNIERILSAPGTVSFLASFSKLGGLGFSLWYVSGYPPASLPLYYWGISGAMSWYNSRCCHNSDVPDGQPHCYRAGSAKLDVAINRIQTKAKDTFAKIQKDPRKFFKWYFQPPIDLKSWTT